MSHVDILNSHSDHSSHSENHSDNRSSYSSNDSGNESNDDDTVTYDKPPTNFPINPPNQDVNQPDEIEQDETEIKEKRCCSFPKLLLVSTTLLLLFVLYSNPSVGYDLIIPNNQNLSVKSVPKPIDWWNIYNNWCCVIPENLDNYGHRLYDCSANNRCLYYLSNWLQSQNLTTQSPLIKRCCYDVRAFGHPTSNTFCSLACLNTVRS